MAGTKKKKFDDAPVSKTARASATKGKKKDEGFIASADMDRIIPLNGGTWAYVLDPRDGKTHHLRVGSETWDAMINALLEDPRFGPKVQSQLTSLMWSNPCLEVAASDLGPHENRF
jgi:hypothetical protein